MKMLLIVRETSAVPYNRIRWLRCAVFSVWDKASKGIRQIRSVSSREGLSRWTWSMAQLLEAIRRSMTRVKLGIAWLRRGWFLFSFGCCCWQLKVNTEI